MLKSPSSISEVLKTNFFEVFGNGLKPRFWAKLTRKIDCVGQNDLNRPPKGRAGRFLEKVKIVQKAQKRDFGEAAARPWRPSESSNLCCRLFSLALGS